MSISRIPQILLAQITALFALALPFSAGAQSAQHPVSAELVSSVTAIVPSRAFDVGLRLEMEPGWHTYWEYSGDAGLATDIIWSLPEGFSAGPIQWPPPRLTVEPGDIWAYGYKGEVLLVVKIVPPKDLKPGTDVTLSAKASWLVCKELCVPGSADVRLVLPVAETSAPSAEGLFQTAWGRIPSDQPPPFGLQWKKSDVGWTLSVAGLPTGATAELFPLPADGQGAEHPKATGPGTFLIPGSGNFRGILAVGTGDDRTAWRIASESAQAFATSAVPAKLATIGLWIALFYGFLGGLILNLMPCVLPVISLKVFGFIKQADQSPGKIFAHGLAFTGGIFAWFLGLAAVVVFLKSSGTEVTWAFQFQNPWFNAVIGSLVFVFALNLFGVFEVILPGRASNAMESAAASNGLGGSFFQGVFATLLATPCTAPFLGTALGFAFSQSSSVIIAMFASVAFGMASPYLLLTARPGWMRFLPRPGAWMERLRQFMGFPLMATLVWILGIVGGQRGSDGVFWFLCFLLCLAITCWLYGGFCGPLSTIRARATAILLALLVSGVGGWYFLGQKFASVGAEESDGIAWIPFSAQKLADLQADGKSVFVDFTADWCITCKYNERTAINTPTIRAILAEKRIVPMKADWTNANPEITAALKTFGRVGVPFYVIYQPGHPPVTLPELLTESLLAEALKKLP